MGEPDVQFILAAFAVDDAFSPHIAEPHVRNSAAAWGAHVDFTVNADNTQLCCCLSLSVAALLKAHPHSETKWAFEQSWSVARDGAPFASQPSDPILATSIFPPRCMAVEAF
ncbi:unnamed protein product [Symbiodinium natans]|uniref:Uncharacterized protein n=1 Tax=Symbiodinium natans TaxID=878477 RepID=A0A812JJI7_9DINO|nr:unnamed protein product [Symbiodinium natans]